MGLPIKCHDCGISEKNDKTIQIRQCDWLLCDTCQASRASGVIRKKGSYVRGATAKSPPSNSARKTIPAKSPPSLNCAKITTPLTFARKTTSGEWQIEETPPATERRKVKGNDNQSCTGTACTVKSGEVACCCFICNNMFHLACVSLNKRPSKSSNWCCSNCKNVPAMIADMKNTINVLSAWQKSIYEQQQLIKAENSALKHQIAEIMASQKDNQALRKAPSTSAKKHDECMTESDIPLTTSDEDSPWFRVQRRRKRSQPKQRNSSQNDENKQIHYNRTLRYDSRESSDQTRNRKRTLRYDSHESNDRDDHYVQESRRPLRNANRGLYRNKHQPHKHDQAPQRSWNTNYKPQRARYHETRSDVYRTSACFNCGLSNHSSKDCHFSYPVTCRTCGEIGHKSRWHADQNDLRNCY